MLKNWLCKMLASRFVTLDTYEMDEKEQNEKLAALEKRVLMLEVKDVSAVRPLDNPGYYRTTCTTGSITLNKLDKPTKKKKAAK